MPQQAATFIEYPPHCLADWRPSARSPWNPNEP